MVGRGVPPRAREREQRLHGRSDRRRPLAPAGPPRPIATTTTPVGSRERRATWPVTAVFPTRLPVPITASVGTSDGDGAAAGRSGNPALRRARPSASTRRASASRSGGPSTGSSDRSSTTSGCVPRDRRLDGRRERNAVVLAAAELLGAADEDGRDDEVVELLERLARRPAGSARRRDRDARVSSSRSSPRGSILPVYFSYSKVSVENWMMRSSPWNGWRRQIDTWVPLISTTL